MAEYDPMAPDARRFPRVITEVEIAAMPRLDFNMGIDTAIFLSRERDDARYFRQGYCYMEPDHEPFHWEQATFDETHFCLEGRIKLRVEDKAGRQVVLEAGEGELIYLPGGYAYTLEASKVAMFAASSSGPSPRPGVTESKEYSRQLTALRAA